MFKRLLILLALAPLPALAVPIASGNATAIGDVPVSIAPGIGSSTVGRVNFFSPANNITAAATAAGLTAATLNGLPGGPFRGAATVGQLFTGGVLTDGIRFTVSATPLVISGSPTFAYFAALDDLTGANPTMFMPLSLGFLPQTFEFLLPAAGNYRLTVGALRTNEVGTYSVAINMLSATGFGTPEMEPGSAALPLIFCSTLLLCGSRRRAVSA